MQMADMRTYKPQQVAQRPFACKFLPRYNLQGAYRDRMQHLAVVMPILVPLHHVHRRSVTRSHGHRGTNIFTAQAIGALPAHSSSEQQMLCATRHGHHHHVLKCWPHDRLKALQASALTLRWLSALGDTAGSIRCQLFSVALALALTASCTTSGLACAEVAGTDKPAPPAAAQLQVTVALKSGTDIAGLGPSPTLFLTAKPANYQLPFASKKEVIDNTSSSNNNSSTGAFPRRLLLGSSEDLLVPPEQYQVLADMLQGTDVVISARLDRDGDPNTRDAEDLVGRGVAVWEASAKHTKETTVVLEGRGLFGRLITNRSK